MLFEFIRETRVAGGMVRSAVALRIGELVRMGRKSKVDQGGVGSLAIMSERWAGM